MQLYPSSAGQSPGRIWLVSLLGVSQSGIWCWLELLSFQRLLSSLSIEDQGPWHPAGHWLEVVLSNEACPYCQPHGPAHRGQSVPQSRQKDLSLICQEKVIHRVGSSREQLFHLPHGTHRFSKKEDHTGCGTQVGRKWERLSLTLAAVCDGRSLRTRCWGWALAPQSKSEGAGDRWDIDQLLRSIQAGLFRRGSWGRTALWVW